ncbi:NAD(P)/FAD-dependent oxidoreductase [Aspergillus undulatus]|uniref:NAD(P)/FAD-dependent oxidoreductase n=1 Tax=Aspergillus undulatus TaxID=1810928 RepID=UPI003CCC94C9
MPTIILGGGIIGASIAYYLSLQPQPSSQSSSEREEIHIIESSHTLFSSASGYAAGFLAKDWFEPSLLPLGEYSFGLHESLAKEHGGDKKWGFMKGTALSLGSTDAGVGGARGDDWLRSGTSRAETATSSPAIVEEGPTWLTRQAGTALERISDRGTVAQVDPLRLSHFLLDKALSQGVKLHQPSTATSLITSASGTITAVKILNINTKEESTLQCTNLIIASGSWTPRVFSTLFPDSSAKMPIYPLAGYSLVIRSPRYTYTSEHEKEAEGSHAVFTTHPPTAGFAPEMFSREGSEIYIAGLNSTRIPVPERVEDLQKYWDEEEMDRLKDVTIRLMGKLPAGQKESTDGVLNENDLTILREGLCLRPVSERGVPFVGRVEESDLGGIKSCKGGGIFVAAGHGPWGISLALGTGAVMADLVRGVKPSVDVSGLGLGGKARRAKL